MNGNNVSNTNNRNKETHKNFNKVKKCQINNVDDFELSTMISQIFSFSLF